MEPVGNQYARRLPLLPEEACSPATPAKDTAGDLATPWGSLLSPRGFPFGRTDLLQDPAGVKGDDLLPRHAEPRGIDLVVVGSRLAADRPDPGRGPAHFPTGGGGQGGAGRRPG